MTTHKLKSRNILLSTATFRIKIRINISTNSITINFTRGPWKMKIRFLFPNTACLIRFIKFSASRRDVTLSHKIILFIKLKICTQTTRLASFTHKLFCCSAQSKKVHIYSQRRYVHVRAPNIIYKQVIHRYFMKTAKNA